jgi:hypothetical protein
VLAKRASSIGFRRSDRAAKNVEAVHVGHLNIQEDKVGRQPFDRGDRIATGRTLCDRLSMPGTAARRARTPRCPSGSSSTIRTRMPLGRRRQARLRPVRQINVDHTDSFIRPADLQAVIVSMRDPQTLQRIR